MNVEQYYQVQKAKYFGDATTVIAMLKTRSPRKCKVLANNIQAFERSEWAKVAEDIMYTGVREKFMQNTELRKILMETKGKILAEATQFDNFWANGLHILDVANCDVDNWPGRNTMGRILMKVRDGLVDA